MSAFLFLIQRQTRMSNSLNTFSARRVSNNWMRCDKNTTQRSSFTFIIFFSARAIHKLLYISIFIMNSFFFRFIVALINGWDEWRESLGENIHFFFSMLNCIKKPLLPEPHHSYFIGILGICYLTFGLFQTIWNGLYGTICPSNILNTRKAFLGLATQAARYLLRISINKFFVELQKYSLGYYYEIFVELQEKIRRCKNEK